MTLNLAYYHCIFAVESFNMSLTKLFNTMSVKYKLRQVTTEGSSSYGKYYAVAVVSNTVDMDDISEKIQRNCTVKASDVKAVLSELSEVLRDELLDGSRVIIDGLGSFKVTLRTKTADSPSEWSPSTDLVSAKINFRPETYDQHIAGTRVRSPKALRGLKIEAYKPYSVSQAIAASEASEATAASDGGDGAADVDK